MKKTKTFLVFILAFILGIATAVGLYIYTSGDVDWLSYIEDELIPSAVIAISGIGALCLTLLPTINSINSCLSGFNKATKDVCDTVITDREMLQEIKAYRQELTALKSEVLGAIKEIKAVKGEIADTIAPVENHVENIERIVHIGFEENEDLVKRGIAAKIAKVGASDE